MLTQHPLSDIIFSARFYNVLCWSKSELVEGRSKNLATSMSEGLEKNNFKKLLTYSVTNWVLGKLNSQTFKLEKGCPRLWESLETFITHLDKVLSNVI